MKIGVSDARLEVMIVLSKEGNRGLRQSESVFVYFVFATLFSSLPFGFHLFLFFFFHFFLAVARDFLYAVAVVVGSVSAVTPFQELALIQLTLFHPFCVTHPHAARSILRW